MNKTILLGIIAAVVIPIAVYAASPLFINTTIDEPLPVSMMTESEAADKMSDTMMADKMSDTMMADKMSDTMMADKMPMPKMVSGTFVGVGDGIHDASGMARVVPLDDGRQFLRLEDFRSTNGPDLYVYLASDKDASEFISLGRLKANMGNQNYEIPPDADLERYDTVLIWCQKFSVLFGSAKLA